MRTALLTVLAFGCGSRTNLDEPEIVAAWANSASALAVFLPARLPLEASEGIYAYPDPDCPVIEDTIATHTATGGCTDTQGTTWAGTTRVDRRADGWTVTLDAWGTASTPDADPQTTSGTWEIRKLGPDEHSFKVSSTQDALVEVEVEYDGRVEGVFGGPTVWNGSGTVTRSGFTEADGTVTATTDDQVRDGDLCSNQSASGTTTLVQGKHTVVITYTGALDCDEAQSATFTLDGEDQGELAGVNCAHGGAPALGWLAALGGLALTRRRAARRGDPPS